MTALRTLRSPDILVLETPGAIALRRAEDGGAVGGAARVWLVEAPPRTREAPLARGGGDRRHPVRLPGLAAEAADEPARWPGAARPFQVLLESPDSERLAMVARVMLPRPGTRERDARWPGWLAGDAATLAPLFRRPGGAAAQRHLPVFPGAAARPGPLAEVRAQLRLRAADGTLSDAAHAILAIRHDAATIGLGVADARGHVLVAFAPPPLATPSAAEAAAGNWPRQWEVEVRAWWAPLPAARPGLPPLLEDIVALTAAAPRPLHASLVPLADGSLPPLPLQTLVHGRPLALRTCVSADDPGSSLVLAAP